MHSNITYLLFIYLFMFLYDYEFIVCLHSHKIYLTGRFVVSKFNNNNNITISHFKKVNLKK